MAAAWPAARAAAAALRDRSLITIAALIASGNTEQLTGHLQRARQNGLTETELKEVIVHLAFYAGWPRAMSAVSRLHAFRGTSCPSYTLFRGTLCVWYTLFRGTWIDSSGEGLQVV
jgi:hypothetical protein